VRAAWVRALAKAIQMARERLRCSPEFGGMIVAGVMAASWAVVMSPGPGLICGQLGTGVPSLVQKANPARVAAGTGGSASRPSPR
jgi:hypothetical protein